MSDFSWVSLSHKILPFLMYSSKNRKVDIFFPDEDMLKS